MPEALRAIFDQDAERYDRARPGYPPAVIADLSARAGLGPGTRVLEIGPGTGQATLDLARLGPRVTAVELGPHLAGVLRRRSEGLPVEVHVGAFETWPLPPSPFDAVTSFTAWHWLDPTIRSARAAAALRPGGTLATVTTSHVRGGGVAFFAAMQAVYEYWDPSTPPGLRLAESADIPPDLDEVDSSPDFGPATRTRHEQDISYSRDEYLDLLLTYSGHRALPAPRQAGLLCDLGTLIDEHGGEVTKRYLYEVRVARRS
jgi:SAM-dependent methyltransferase